MLNTRLVRRSAARALRGQTCRSHVRYLSQARRLAQQEQKQNDQTTHFGFETITEAAKEGRGRLLSISDLMVS